MALPTVGLTTTITVSAQVTGEDTLGNDEVTQYNTGGDSKLGYSGNYTNPQANTIYTVPTKFHASRRTITVSSLTLDVDLTALTDFLGNVFGTSTILGIYIKNRDTGYPGLLVGGNGPANWWQGLPSAAEQLDPLGEKFMSSPLKGKLANAVSRILRFQNNVASASAVTFDLYVWAM